MYDQKEVQIREAIYETISWLVFLDIKNELSTAAVQLKLIRMHDALDSMVYNDTLTKLTGMHYTNNIKIYVYLSTMKELWEQLAKIDGPLSDDQSLAYICTSIEDLIAYIYQEADAKAVDKNADMTDENIVMIAAHLYQSNKKQKAKTKKLKLKCENCEKKKEKCFAKSCKKEGEVSDWWKMKFANKLSSEKNQKHVNIADSIEDKYSFLSSKDDIALTVTTANTFKETLHLQSLSFLPGIIINCGATSHLSPIAIVLSIMLS